MTPATVMTAPAISMAAMHAADLNILAFDTVTEACSVALSAGGEVAQLQESGARHSRRVLGMADEVMRAAGVELRDLDALAVDVGPGAFTGARLGIGVAQGLAYGAGLPVIPVNSLEALAHSARGDGGDGALILPAIDARMGQVYFALHNAAGELTGPALAAPDEVGTAVADKLAAADRVTGLGSGWDQYASKLQESMATVKSPVVKWLPGRHPEAASVARIASARGLTHTVDPLHLRAVYIRNTVAQPASR